ncbi:MAG: hypothetical protein AAGA33_02085 [Pseudomonadota bacterium]
MTRRLTLAMGLLAFAIPALANDDIKTEFDVKIVAIDGDDPVNIAFSSDSIDFDPMNLQIGENRSFTDDQGRNILVSRDETGFQFNIDGKTIELPAFDEVIDVADIDINVDTDSRVVVERIGGGDGITILSSEAIDDATRQSIEAILQSAGYDDAVHFVDDATMKKVHKVIRVEKAL